jgi:DNA repair exonuclease SbcCD ATPase subunit
MKLVSVRICNFRSFQQEQCFTFPEESGLYFMQGVNNQEPRLEANGAGKSTLWEAILWCLFGKTSRGLKAGDVCNWNVEKGTNVRLAYVGDEGNVSMQVVERSWKPNSWTITDLFGNVTDLTKDGSNQVLAGLQLEFAPFLHCILMAQGQPMFLDLKADRQAELFSEVMDLDHWLTYSSNASKKASSQDIETRRLERQLSELVGRIDGQQDFKGSVEQWQQDHDDKIKALEEPYLKLVERRRVLAVELQEFEREEASKQGPMQKVIADLAVINTQLQDGTRAEQKAWQVADRANGVYQAAWNRYEQAKKATSCPTCHRSVDPVEHKRHIREADLLLTEFKQQYVVAEEHAKAVASAGEKVGKLGLALIERRHDLQKALDEIGQDIRSTRQKINQCDKEMDALEDQEDRLKAEVNPFLDIQKKAREEGARLRAARDDTQWLLDESVSKHRLLSFWVRGFKELRLQLIAEALTELEIEVNSCVTALGLVNWELRFQVDRETKGGSISRGFSVEVLSPVNSKPTPWEAWSGGESQRLRLAATMGLSNLIRSRMGVNLDLEVWDEPSTALSQQGVRDLLEALKHRAEIEQRQIWVVDHTSHSFGGFAGGATITKGKSGSTIEQY